LVENLFHEFGHAMHSALARTRYQHASGTRCQTDIAEIPSQWMEYFVYEPRVVKLFARHYQTGQIIPDELLQRLHLAQNCFQAHRTQVQVNYFQTLSFQIIFFYFLKVACAMFDHAFHGPYPLSKSYDKLYSSLLTKYTSLPYISSTYPYLKFYHLVDYGARFSSYIIARSIASKIWHDQFFKDPLSKTTGEQFRKSFLQWGGEREPNELIGNMFSLTKKLTIDDMTNAITDEIKENIQKRDSLFK
jgi:intermediate peptidase